MSLPTGHSALGACLYLAFNKKDTRLIKRWKEIALYIFNANVPDLDYIPYFIFRTRESFAYHHWITHTLGFAMLYGAIMAALCKKFRNGTFMERFMVFFALVYSHVLLDTMANNGIPPVGVMLFYPFDSTYICSPITIFGLFLDQAIHTPLGGEMLSINQTRYLLMEISFELLIFTPIGFLIWYLRSRKPSPSPVLENQQSSG
jgi:membrane-bound metal-dependent hydrolase YbcI (DUF457 family)